MEARASLLYSLSVAGIWEMGEILVGCGLGQMLDSVDKTAVRLVKLSHVHPDVGQKALNVSPCMTKSCNRSFA